MKIIAVDNYDRETVSDILVCKNCDEYEAKIMCEALNEKLGGPSSPRFFKVVEDDYKLYKWEP